MILARVVEAGAPHELSPPRRVEEEAEQVDGKHGKFHVSAHVGFVVLHVGEHVLFEFSFIYYCIV